MDQVVLRERNENKKELDELEALRDETEKAYKKNPRDSALCDELKYVEWQIEVRSFHKEMQSELGDRSFDHINSQLLSEKVSPLYLKVGYALYGQPCQNGTGLYEKKEMKCIEDVCQKIEKNNKKLNGDRSIYLSIIFIPCLPNIDCDVPKEQVLFIVGNGKSTDIRIIVKRDHKIRVYKSWRKFKNDKPFPNCSYALPKDGKYQAGLDGYPLLEFIKFQSGKLATKVANALGNASTGFASAGFALGIASPFLPFLAPLAAGATIAYKVGKLRMMSIEDEKTNNNFDSKVGRVISIDETGDTFSRKYLSTIESINATNPAPTISLLATLCKIVEQTMDFKTRDSTLNISNKHKELLAKTMMLMHHSSLEDTHKAQFRSYVLFFFNVLVNDHKAYINKFIEKFIDTIAKTLPPKTNDDIYKRHEHQPKQCLKLEESDETNTMIDILMGDITKILIQISSEIRFAIKLSSPRTFDQNTQIVECFEGNGMVVQQTAYNINSKAQLYLNSDYPTKDEMGGNIVERGVKLETYVQLKNCYPKTQRELIIDSNARSNLNKVRFEITENVIDESFMEWNSEHEVNEVEVKIYEETQKSYFNNWGVKCALAGLLTVGLFVTRKYYMKL